MIGKSLHFKCDCLFPIDSIGRIVGYYINGTELVFKVEMNGKIVDISENHPKLNVKES